MAIRSARIMMGLAAAFIFASGAMAKECYAPDERAQQRGFSRVVSTEGGKTLWLAGHTAIPNTPFDQQVRSIFADIDKNIKATGGAGLADLVTITVYITDARLAVRFIELRKEVFRECFPASALITVAGLAQPGLLIEIQGIAVIGSR